MFGATDTQVKMMKTLLTTMAFMLALGVSSQASAACYADYKAKKNQPLQLHYGVIQLPDNVCGSPGKISQTIQRRISVGGWRLLNVMSVFGPDGLNKRRASAGKFFLRY